MPEGALRQWIDQAELTALEQEVSGYSEGEVDIPEGLFSQFGQDLPEPRQMDGALQYAIYMVQNEGRWQEAVIVFRAQRESQPDYDAPYSWQVNFLKHHMRFQSAINLAKLSATKCRRKSLLLWCAADNALRAGEVRKAMHHYAQCIAALREPPRHTQATRLSAFLTLAELLDVFGDVEGARWAWEAQKIIVHKDDEIERIRRTAAQTPESERAQILGELPAIMEHLTARTYWLR
nr:hypothetical protein OG781_03195 [Streptomyces sp. NBC_00830]